MTSFNTLYLEGYFNDHDDEVISVSIDTYIVVFVLLNCENRHPKVCLVNLGRSLSLTVPKSSLKSFNLRIASIDEFKILGCKLPLVWLRDRKTIISGLCSVLRWVIKDLGEREPNHPSMSLLGFRRGCLVSCAESSLWTTFCELDLPQTTRNVIEATGSEMVPKTLLRLESHLRMPVRTHNILKRKQDLRKMSKLGAKVVSKALGSNSTETNGNESDLVATRLSQMSLSEDSLLEHCYLEGIDFTLADIIALPCMYWLFVNLAICTSCSLPSISKWYQRVLQLPSVVRVARVLGWKCLNTLDCLVLPQCHNEVAPSLHLNEGTLYSRSLCGLKINSKNLNPTSIMAVLKDKDVIPLYEENKLPKLQWDKLPLVLHPASGDLPEKRILRKCQQLENIVSAVYELALPNQTIVDFCSGGGHVGLLLAYSLPHCKVLLIENKEDSVSRARKRAEALKLENIRFYQCNLDYFDAPFDVGVCLHACGVATDLVINKCIAQNASFVTCPCCYGAIQETHHLKYPLSQRLHNVSVSYKDFITLAHCADRTETNTAKLEQGVYCMGLVDTDRKFYAEEHKYEVRMLKMDPPTCSPKHNLLLGKKLPSK